MNPATPFRRLPWPAPALLGWGLAWLAWTVLRQAGSGELTAAAAGCAAAAVVAVTVDGRWRRTLVAAGFPLSLAVLGAGLPGWAWVLAAASLLAAYPLRAWRDAPFFPTPGNALRGLAGIVPLGRGARMLDAGCGAGHGLQALRSEFPEATLEGVEWSWPLALLCRLRCRFARVRRADMWAQPWTGHDLVYVFQRPESMARVMAKAEAELAPGSWLVSLEFEVAGARAHARLDAAGGRPVWVYRIAQPAGSNRRRDGR